MTETNSDVEREIYDRLVCSKHPQIVRPWIPLTMSKDGDLLRVTIQPGLVYAILSVRPTTWWHSENSDLQIQFDGGVVDLYLSRTGRVVVCGTFQDAPNGLFLVDSTRYEEPFDNREWSLKGDSTIFFLPCICVDWKTAWLSLAHVFMFGKREENSPWVSSEELEERFGPDVIKFNVFDGPHPEPLYWGP